MVADKTVAKLESIASKTTLSQIGHEDEVPDAALAQWWLEYGISRKETKRNCMTFLSVGADKTVAKLEEGVKNKPMAETLQEDEVTDAAFAQWWLDYGITRKITKRPIISPRS